MDAEAVARKFLSLGLQSWGQTVGDRVRAAQVVIDTAGFDAKVTGYPFSIGSWAGKDAAEAQKWLNGVCATMPWGKYETECDHIRAAIEKRQQETSVTP